jgi:hypothetical protein
MELCWTNPYFGPEISFRGCCTEHETCIEEDEAGLPGRKFLIVKLLLGIFPRDLQDAVLYVCICGKCAGAETAHRM